MKIIIFAILALLIPTSAMSWWMVMQGSPPSDSTTDFTQDANIISWWFFEDSSTPSLDGSNNDNDMTWDSNVSRSTESVQGSYSIDFDTDNYEGIGITDANLAPAAFPGKETEGALHTFSFGCWARMDAGVGQDEDGLVIGKWNTGEYQYRIIYDYSETDFSLETSDNGWGYAAVALSTAGVTQDTWTLVVGTVANSSSVILYVGEDGDSAVTSYEDTSEANLEINMGDGPDFSVGRTIASDEFGGQIDECFIFSDILTEDEVNEILNNGLAGDR